MGQLIEVRAVVLGDVAIFDTDRSLSGQDGETFTSVDGARAGDTYPALVAAALFEHDAALVSVYVYSNTISVKRSGQWSDEQAAEASDVIRNFLVYYEENRDES